MEITGTAAKVELTATADLTSVNTSGSATIGTPSRALTYNTAPNVAYSLRMQIAAGSTLTFDGLTGAVTGSTSGTAQVETLTAAGTVTQSGNAVLTLTSAKITSGPLIIQFSVLATDTPTAWAAKARVALAASPEANAIFIPGGATTAITLTQRENDGNDTSLVLTVANGNSVGITAASSANTTPGVMASKAYRMSGSVWDQTDYQGDPLPSAMSYVYTVLLQCEVQGSQLTIESTSSDITVNPTPIVRLESNPDGQLLPWQSTVELSAAGNDAILTLDIHAGE